MTSNGFEVAPDLLGLVDKVALICGGGGDLGRASAVQLARAGAHVAVVDVDPAAAQRTVDAVEQVGRKGLVVEADVLDLDSMQAAVAEVRSKLGPLHGAVNVVGGLGPGGPMTFLEMSVEEWTRVLQRNLWSAFICTKAESASMLEDGTRGSIVNFGSTSGVAAGAMVSHYGAAKAGVIHFTKSAALELAPNGIRVNCVIPGNNRTTKWHAFMDDESIPPERKEWHTRTEKTVPMGRFGEPMELGGVVMFLISDLSNYMTGHLLQSDGGVIHTTARPQVDQTTVYKPGG